MKRFWLAGRRIEKSPCKRLKQPESLDLCRVFIRLPSRSKCDTESPADGDLSLDESRDKLDCSALHRMAAGMEQSIAIHVAHSSSPHEKRFSRRAMKLFYPLLSNRRL